MGYAAGRAVQGDYSATMDINTSASSPTFSFKVGRAFAKSNQYPAAIACFNETLDGGISAPNDAIAHLNRGDTYARMGAKDKARVDLQQAVVLFKKYKLPSYQKEAEKLLQDVSR